VADPKDAIKPIVENKKARFDYAIDDTFEAGLVLRGSEVKSLRNGQAQLKDSYVAFSNGEAWLQNAHVSEYRASSYLNHVPERKRKLLLHREELRKIERAIQEKGYTCVPLRLYFKKGRVKAEIGLAKGKKHADKRVALKERDAKRELAQTMKKSRR
jgi:SsrA-binding protein